MAAWAGRVVVLKDGRNLTELRKADVPTPQALAARYQEVVGAGAS